jgi:DNA-binding transcriptional regulator YdaS (Cro superfamily)
MEQAETSKHPIRPTDLANALDCSVPYASQMLNGVRAITVPRALLILDKTGHKLGPLAAATDAEIALLRKFTPATEAA